MENDMNRPVNKNSWFWMAPEYFSKWRVFPRGFIIVYFWLIVQTAMWFMGLPVPTPSQAAFASAVIGAGAAWFGLYVNSSPTGSGTLSPQQRSTVEALAAAAELPDTYTTTPEPVTDESEPELTVTTTYRPRIVGRAEHPREGEVSDLRPTYRAEG